jgi:FtsH-binding integral membrane protein
MEKKLKVLGIVSLLLGALAALFCLFPGGIMLALPVGFLGMIASSAYIYFDTRDEVNKSMITSGIISMFLSSIPVLLILAIIIKNHFKH